MDKVQDINKKGVAFSGISEALREKDYKTFDSILKSGLLGGRFDKPNIGLTKEKYLKNVKEEKDAVVWFNIVGVDSRSEKIKDSGFLNEYTADSNVLAIIFDLTHFQETPSSWEESQRIVNLKQKRRTHRRAYSGFILSHRVPPRYFKGIVLKLLDEKGKDISCHDYLNKALDISRKMRSSVKKREYIIPIYDRNGNLLWPLLDKYKDQGFMPYEEVKKFMEERERNKKEQKE